MKIRHLKNAFTLIELLVVIAVLSVLAAILFPVFAQVRDDVRSASCLSNLKQIGLASRLYLQDYDEKHVPYCMWQGSGGHIGLGDACFFAPQVGQCGHPPVIQWTLAYGDPKLGLLWPYSRNTGIYTCPSFENKAKSYYGYSPSKYASYAVNLTVAGQFYYRPPIMRGSWYGDIYPPYIYESKTDAEISRPTEIFHWMEATGFLQYAHPASWEQYGSAPWHWTLAPRHQEMMNVSFVDGHTKAFRPDAFIPLDREAHYFDTEM